MPNATECATNGDVQRSHVAQDARVELKLENIYGMMVLLGLGLVGGAIAFMAEVIKKKFETHKKVLQQRGLTLRRKWTLVMEQCSPLSLDQKKMG